VIVGAPDYTDGQTGEGATFIYSYKAALPTATPTPAPVPATSAGAALGLAVLFGVLLARKRLGC